MSSNRLPQAVFFYAQSEPALNSLVKEKEAVEDFRDRWEEGETKTNIQIKLIDVNRASRFSDKVREYRKNLVVLSFSGHANEGALLFDNDKDTYAKAKHGYVSLLRDTSNLRLLILNACATADQVEDIFRGTSVDIIIATNTGVYDDLACRFQQVFMEELLTKKTRILKAFRLACASVSHGIEKKRDKEKQQGVLASILRGVGIQQWTTNSWTIYFKDEEGLQQQISYPFSKAIENKYSPQAIFDNPFFTVLNQIDGENGPLIPEFEQHSCGRKEQWVKVKKGVEDESYEGKKKRFYFLPGSENECHDSFLLRFSYSYHVAPPKVFDMVFPQKYYQTPKLEQIKLDLLSMLGKRLSATSTKGSGQQRFASLPKNIIELYQVHKHQFTKEVNIFKIDIHESNWDQEMVWEGLQWLVNEFCCQSDENRRKYQKKLAEIPLFFFFFNIIYEDRAVGALQGAKVIYNLIHKVRREARSLMKEAPYAEVLDELTRVRFHEIDHWIKTNVKTEHPVKNRKAMKKKYFPKLKKRTRYPMLYVQEQLNKLIEDYNS